MQTDYGLRTHIFGMKADDAKGVRPVVGMWLHSAVEAHLTLRPDEAREIAAELIAAANLAEGGKA